MNEIKLSAIKLKNILCYLDKCKLTTMEMQTLRTIINEKQKKLERVQTYFNNK